MAQPDNTSKTLRIKDWGRFQHFKDRRPIWVKLYRDLLDDIEWHRLDPTAAKTLVMLWLVAAEDMGDLPAISELAFRLRLQENATVSIISRLGHWLENVDAALISSGYQSDIPEKRREQVTSEKVTSERREQITGNGADAPLSECQQAFEAYNIAAKRHNLSLARGLSAERKKKLQVVLKEIGIEGWMEALQNIEEMPFCAGENERGWKVSFKWLLSLENVTKILEKVYLRDVRVIPMSAKERAAQNVRDVTERMIQEAREKDAKRN